MIARLSWQLKDWHVRTGAGMTSTVSAKRQRSTEAVGVPILDEVYPVWLEAAPGERWVQIPHSRQCESLCREGTIALLGNDDSLKSVLQRLPISATPTSNVEGCEKCGVDLQWYSVTQCLRAGLYVRCRPERHPYRSFRFASTAAKSQPEQMECFQ